jgi:hypothetical protein
MLIESSLTARLAKPVSSRSLPHNLGAMVTYLYL